MTALVGMVLVMDMWGFHFKNNFVFYLTHYDYYYFSLKDRFRFFPLRYFSMEMRLILTLCRRRLSSKEMKINIKKKQQQQSSTEQMTYLWCDSCHSLKLKKQLEYMVCSHQLTSIFSNEFNLKMWLFIGDRRQVSMYYDQIGSLL